MDKNNGLKTALYQQHWYQMCFSWTWDSSECNSLLLHWNKCVILMFFAKIVIKVFNTSVFQNIKFNYVSSTVLNQVTYMISWILTSSLILSQKNELTNTLRQFRTCNIHIPRCVFQTFVYYWIPWLFILGLIRRPTYYAQAFINFRIPDPVVHHAIREGCRWWTFTC